MSLSKYEIRQFQSPELHRAASRSRAQYDEAFECPECKFPTFLPHGDEDVDTDDLRRVPRWLCKQCGYYIGPEGEAWALYDPVVDLTDTPLKVWGCWQLKKDASEWSYLPRDVLKEHAEEVRRRAGIE